MQMATFPIQCLVWVRQVWRVPIQHIDGKHTIVIYYEYNIWAVVKKCSEILTPSVCIDAY